MINKDDRAVLLYYFYTKRLQLFKNEGHILCHTKVTPEETGVRDRPYSHTYTYTKETVAMTTLINTASWIGLPSIAGWLKKQSVKFKARRLANETIKQLSALSNRELNDMGLSRCDIRYVAEEHYDDMVNKNLRGWV
jgi:uncharacterized protein YjiS (DUF1127 family)